MYFNVVRNRIVVSMACISHLSFSAEQKFLFKYVYKKSLEDCVTRIED